MHLPTKGDLYCADFCPSIPPNKTLFGAVSATLTEFAANPRLGDVPAFLLILQTWKQDLGRHVHRHALVASGALSNTGEAVLEYLGRYTHRVAISNERIVEIDAGEVVFRVRAHPESGTKRVVRLPGVEVIDRFLHHVLPAGFKRIRHDGL